MVVAVGRSFDAVVVVVLEDILDATLASILSRVQICTNMRKVHQSLSAVGAYRARIWPRDIL